jgi:hypothetical protein
MPDAWLAAAPICLPPHVYQGLRAAELAGVRMTDLAAVEGYARVQGDWWTLRFLFGERKGLYEHGLRAGFAVKPLADLAGLPLEGGN